MNGPRLSTRFHLYIYATFRECCFGFIFGWNMIGRKTCPSTKGSVLTTKQHGLFVVIGIVDRSNNISHFNMRSKNRYSPTKW